MFNSVRGRRHATSPPQRLVNGGDPWAAFDRWNGADWHFAALPVTAQLFVPFAWLPEGVGLAIFVGSLFISIALVVGNALS